MKGEPEFDLVEFVRSLDRRKIPYLLIGRWAVILHGGSMMTADYDFWISAAEKEQVLSMVERLDWEVPDRRSWKGPIQTVYCGPERIDLFFHRTVTNGELQRIGFDECWKRAVVRRDVKSGFSIRIPCLEDLIALKKVERSRPEDAVKDLADIRFLEAVRRLPPEE